MSFPLPAAARPGRAQQSSESAASQPLHIVLGKSVILNLESRLKRVLISDPAIIDALVTSPNQIVIEAKAPGPSSLILWDESNFSRMLDVTVDLDVTGLRTAIENAYPNLTVNVRAEGGRLVLSGAVPDQRTGDALVKMAGIYSKETVDSLDRGAAHQQQILLEVKIVEVDRTKLEQIGFNFLSTGAANTPGVISTQQFGAISGAGGSSLPLTGTIPGALAGAATTFGVSDLLNIFLFRPDLNLGATIKALQEDSVLQILAEPRLMALNGVKASFLAGGEFPFPVVQGGANIGAVTIQFRPYGVRLDFTGFIASDGTIRLQVAPEVSSLDFTNAITISGFTVPAIATRRAETEIELKDGQSFGIGGLLDQRTTALLSKIPGIGDIPILGKLFQSRSIQKTNSELVVLVAPHIVDPLKAGTPAMEIPSPPMLFLDKKQYDQHLPDHKDTETTPTPPAAK